EPVVARQPAAEARAHLAEREVDLVVHHEHVVEVDTERTASGGRRAAGVVHEGLREEHADARPARAGPAIREQARVLLLRARELPAPRHLVRHLEADVVARARVALARVPEPDDQPVGAARAGAAATEEAQESSPPGPAPA